MTAAKKVVTPGSTPSPLATDRAYLDHVIAALRVATYAEPLSYMDKFPYPEPSRPQPISEEAAERIHRPVQLDLFDSS